jgi:hypothetical protein
MSSLRKQGPITTGFFEEKPSATVPNVRPRRIGPCVRRDDIQGGRRLHFWFSEIVLDGGVETAIDPNHPVPIEGRFAVVIDVGRDAMDADGAQRRSAPEADGEIVWS